jgi:signal transduction histidine kinase
VLTRPVGIPHIFQLGGSTEVSAVLREAAQQAFPGAVTVRLATRAELSLAETASRGDLLVLCEPDAGAVSELRAEVDGAGLPRWAIVVLGAPDSAFSGDVIPGGTRDAQLIARVLALVWERHELRRENAQFRGDLRAYASRVTHDLRTPLGGVVTTAEMLREILAEDAPQDVELVQPILDSADGLVKLLERTSFFARASASRDPRRRFEMGTAFWNAYQRIEGAMLKAKSTLVQPSAWPQVDGHENWFEFVWRTLLENALQHGTPSGKIEAGWNGTDGGNRFWLRSAGAIADEKKAGMFTPFNRLHEPGAPRGLGLPFVRRLIELDGGTCGFDDSAPGIVEFYFLLPVVSSDDPVTQGRSR